MNITENAQLDSSEKTGEKHEKAGNKTTPITDDTDTEVFMIFIVFAGLAFIILLITVLACIQQQKFARDLKEAEKEEESHVIE